MSTLRFGLLLGLLLLVAGALGPSGAGASAGVVGPPDPPVGFARALERSQAWMAANLGEPAPRTWGIGNAHELATCGREGMPPDGLATEGCSGLASDDRVDLAPWVVRGIDRYGPTLAVEALYVLRHEAGHAGGHRASPFDEAIVDAELWDTWPSWSRAVTGQVLDYPMLSSPLVGVVRTWSVRITGAPWRSRDARLARRALWAAGDAERDALWAAGWGR